MSKTILAHLSKNLSNTGTVSNLLTCLYDPNMLEKIAFRVGDLIHGTLFNSILAASSSAMPLAAILSLTERVPWGLYYKTKIQGNLLLISLDLVDKAKRELKIIQNADRITAVVYLVNKEKEEPATFFEGLNIKTFSLTSVENMKNFKGM